MWLVEDFSVNLYFKICSGIEIIANCQCPVLFKIPIATKMLEQLPLTGVI